MDIRRVFDPSKDFWLLALVCPRVWTLFILRSLIPNGPVSFEVFYFSEAATALAIAFVFHVGRASRERTEKRTPRPVIFAMCLASLLPIATTPSLKTQLTLIGAALGGFTMVWCYMQCVFVYSRLSERRLIAYVLVSFSIGALVRFPLEMIPLEISSVLVAPLPLVCLFMCRQALRNHTGDRAAKEYLSPEVRQSGLVPYVTILFLFGLALGNFYFDIQVTRDDVAVISAGMAFKTIVPLLVLFLLVRRRRTLNVVFLCQIALVLILTSLIVIASSHQVRQSLATSIASDYTRHTISLLLVTTLAILSRRLAHHPFVTFGFGWAAFPLSMALGMTTPDLAGDAIYSSSFMMYVIYFLVASTILVLVFAEKRDHGPHSCLSLAKNGSFSEFESLDRACETIGKQNHLTQREAEVIQLICRGRSKRYIAERFTISENTVRGYARNAYRKLDVHSRQELLDLLENS